MKRSTAEWSLWFAFHAFVATGCIALLGLVATAGVWLLSVLGGTVYAAESGVVLDEPMIITESQGTVTGVWGDKAVNLNTVRGPRGGQTFGTIGDDVILIDHVPERRFRMRLRMEVDDGIQTQPGGDVTTHAWESPQEVSNLQSKEE